MIQMDNKGKSLKKPGRIHYAWFIMLACMMFQLTTTGIFSNSISIFYVPLATELDTTRAAVAMFGSIKNIVLLIMLPFIGRILEKLNINVIYTVAVSLTGIGFSGLCLVQEIWQVWAMAVILGIGAAVLTYIAVPFLINNWFKKNLGLAMGVAMACTGVGSLIFNPFAGYLIDAFSWRTGVLTLGIIGLVLALPFAIFVVKRSPSDKGLLKYGDDGVQTVSGEAIASPLKGLKLKEFIKTPSFYIAVVATFTLCLTANMQPHIAGHVQSVEGYSSLIAGAVMSAVSIGTLLGKPLWGFMIDKTGLRVTVVVAEVLMITSCVLFLASIAIPVLYVGGFLFGLTYVMITIYPAMTVQKLTGNLDYARIYSFIVYGNAAAAIVGAPTFGWVYDTFGSYDYSFMAVIGCAAVTIVLYFIALAPMKKLVAKWHE